MVQSDSTCSISDCSRPVYIIHCGLCSAHYVRLRRYGDPLAGQPMRGQPWQDRFWSSVKKTDSCWLWVGTLGTREYGMLRVRGKNYKAHRVSYELLVGPIPHGLELDHLCRVHSCVNPAHLEAVTHIVNMRRGTLAMKTHCLHGHEFTPENTYYSKREGHRRCRSCVLGREKQNRLAKREAV